VGRAASGLAAAIGEIDRLRLANQGLAEENAQLRAENARLEAVRRENEQLTALLQLRSGLEHATVAAQVIGRESSEFRRVVTIDRGTNDAVEEGDVVIAAGGALAGRVIAVGGGAASVLLVNDTDSRVVGQMATTAATGEVVGQLGGVLVMRNIDATEELQLNEEVVTAGLELQGGVRSPYPKGLIIGQVVDVHRDANDVVQTAFIQPAVDLEKLEYVFVITDYEGGLPAPEDQPTECTSGGADTLPEGEAPCFTPGPSPQASATPPRSRPSSAPAGATSRP
jgi:rod shape-determining protein MreC